MTVGRREKRNQNIKAHYVRCLLLVCLGILIHWWAKSEVSDRLDQLPITTGLLSEKSLLQDTRRRSVAWRMTLVVNGRRFTLLNYKRELLERLEVSLALNHPVTIWSRADARSNKIYQIARGDRVLYSYDTQQSALMDYNHLGLLLAYTSVLAGLVDGITGLVRAARAPQSPQPRRKIPA